MLPHIVPGCVIEVDERYYCFGLGRLRLRVTAVGGLEQRTDGAWLHLRGHEQRRDGTEHRERFALVRVGAVRVVDRPTPQAGGTGTAQSGRTGTTKPSTTRTRAR